jgi:uncharacterized small protein (DUF1192 family)
MTGTNKVTIDASTKYEHRVMNERIRQLLADISRLKKELAGVKQKRHATADCEATDNDD